jgi:hypothetical protein
MLERDARRRYNFELGGALVLYVVVLFSAIKIAKPMDPGAARTALLLAPMIPIGLVIWAIARQFRRMDEFVRLRSLESVSLAAAVTAGWTMTYGFLELAGFPRLSMFVVWPIMGAVWGIHACVRGRITR